MDFMNNNGEGPPGAPFVLQVGNFDVNVPVEYVNHLVDSLLGQHNDVVYFPPNPEDGKVVLLSLCNTVTLAAVRMSRDPPTKVSELELRGIEICMRQTWYNDQNYCGFSQMNVNETLKPSMKLICDPVNKFPMLYVKIAEAILQKIEYQGWESQDEQIDGAQSQALSSQLPVNSVYADNGIMHHIIRQEDPIRYNIEPGYARGNFKVFGDNGFNIGQCFPMRLALVRDGAHGQVRAGVSGSPTLGAWSIVVSGGYEDLDEDHGNILYYSASKSLGNTAPVPAGSRSAQCLQASVNHQRSVRVFRSYDCKWSGRPSAGIRYDGLYKAESSFIHQNHRRGAFHRFKLVRILGQPGIMTGEPGPALAALFSRANRRPI